MDVVATISNLGFAIFVATYFLIHYKQTLDKIIIIVEDLKHLIKRNNELIEELKQLIIDIIKEKK